jgi:hypothetical protein
MSLPFTDNITVIDAVAATTTSAAYDVSKREQITLHFITAGGTSVFSVDASNDGTNWVTGIAFKDATQTTGSTLAVSKSVASSTAGAIVPAGFRYIRVVATYTSGTATAVLESAG